MTDKSDKHDPKAERARYDAVANREYADIRAQLRSGRITLDEAQHRANIAYMRWIDRKQADGR